MHAHTGVFGPAVRTNASRLGREVRNGGYPVWAMIRGFHVVFFSGTADGFTTDYFMKVKNSAD